MRTLLIRLGWIKMSILDYIEILYKSINFQSKLIVNEAKLIDLDSKKSLSEINFFLFIYSLNKLELILSSTNVDFIRTKLAKRMLSNFFDFQTFNLESLKIFIEERTVFYHRIMHVMNKEIEENNINKTNDFPLSHHYFELLHQLWFKYQLISIDELEKRSMMDMDVFNNMNGALKMRAIFLIALPVFSDSMIDLSKRIRYN